MELLLLVFFCLLTGSEVTFGDDAIRGGIIKDDIYRDAFKKTKVITVDEGRDVTLPCSLNTEDITNKKFVWKKDDRQVFLYDAGDHSNNVNTGQDQQFIQRVSYFRDKLKSGDASITISNMKMADRGKYTCEFPDHPGEIFLVVLFVDGGTEDRDRDTGDSNRDTLDKIRALIRDGKPPNRDIVAEVKDQIKGGKTLEEIIAEIKDGVKGSASGLVAGSVLKLFLLMVFLVFLF